MASTASYPSTSTSSSTSAAHSYLAPSISLRPPPTQTRARSSSTPIQPAPLDPYSRPSPMARHQSHLLSPRSQEKLAAAAAGAGAASAAPGEKKHGRARSASLVTVKEVGGGDGLEASDLGSLGTENWQWVDAKGSWLMHPMLILLGKLLVDAIPGIGHDVSWTMVNCGYMIITYLIFHAMVGLPFENTLPTGGAYDDLTLWEQIDNGAQYTPAKKWLTSVPIGLFLISTHYTRYNPILFLLNFAAVTLVLIPKLPVLHRLRFQFLQPVPDTPGHSRAPSPGPGSASLRGPVGTLEATAEEHES